MNAVKFVNDEVFEWQKFAYKGNKLKSRMKIDKLMKVRILELSKYISVGNLPFFCFLKLILIFSSNLHRQKLFLKTIECNDIGSFEYAYNCDMSQNTLINTHKLEDEKKLDHWWLEWRRHDENVMRFLSYFAFFVCFSGYFHLSIFISLFYSSLLYFSARL